jgi:hypothetical protein
MVQRPSRCTPIERASLQNRKLLEISKELQALNTDTEDDLVGQAAAAADEPWQAV